MPPKTRFTSERLLDAAVALTRREGIGMVTARSVAAELGCSTGPIFTHFGSMDGLHEELMDRIIALFVATASGGDHGDPLVSAGVGWLQFATDEPNLYEAIFLKRHPWHAKWGPVRRKLAEHMADHPNYAHLDRKARFALVGRASIVMHGLGVELWSGRLAGGDLVSLIEELAVPVVEAALARGWTADLHTTSPATAGSPS